MARKTKTQQYLDMDITEFNKMNKDEMRQAVITMARSANRAIRSFDVDPNDPEADAFGVSPAMRALAEGGGKITTSGKSTLNELRAEFMRAKGFLESKTGTGEKWESVKEQTITSLEELGVETTDKEWDTMWKAYEILKERSPEVATKGLKYSVLAEIANLATDKRRTARSIARAMENKLTDIYESEAALNGDNGVSRFIEF